MSNYLISEPLALFMDEIPDHELDARIVVAEKSMEETKAKLEKAREKLSANTDALSKLTWGGLREDVRHKSGTAAERMALYHDLHVLQRKLLRAHNRREFSAFQVPMLKMRLLHRQILLNALCHERALREMDKQFAARTVVLVPDDETKDPVTIGNDMHPSAADNDQAKLDKIASIIRMCVFIAARHRKLGSFDRKFGTSVRHSVRGRTMRLAWTWVGVNEIENRHEFDILPSGEIWNLATGATHNAFATAPRKWFPY